MTLVTRDVKKAFDKVWHNAIRLKLLTSRADENLIRVVSDFLRERKAYIKVNSHKGNIFDLNAGVPQGDVLSPTLFLLVANDYPEPTFNDQQRNFVKQYADDFTQVIVSKFRTLINPDCKLAHKRHVEAEIEKQNNFERKWKIQTNLQKFAIITVGFYSAPDIIVNNTTIPYTRKTSLLGLHFARNNFFMKQVDNIENIARAELKRLYRFRFLRRKLKVRLYKALILPLLTYPVIPLNICSNAQIKRLQVVQNNAIRWIMNERWPLICPLETRHADLKLEYIDFRIKRLAEAVWYKIEEEDSDFHRTAMAIQMPLPHSWFPSSYLKTFE